MEKIKVDKPTLDKLEAIREWYEWETIEDVLKELVCEKRSAHVDGREMIPIGFDGPFNPPPLT